jgi:2-amino-4-hydroxy-6-hydroxymethyldihydropteridine diphosphokinase
MHTIYIGLGSNLGDRLANLNSAIDALPPSVNPMVLSPVYETAPWGYTDQPAFLNQAIRAETSLLPLDLLKHLKSVETSLGRRPSFRYGPRLIDLDILFYDNLILKSSDLIIPHPRLQERAFMLIPLADLAPDLCHPILGKTVQQMLDEVDSRDVKPYPE